MGPLEPCCRKTGRKKGKEFPVRQKEGLHFEECADAAELWGGGLKGGPCQTGGVREKSYTSSNSRGEKETETCSQEERVGERV